jgi:hypothetical protein
VMTEAGGESSAGRCVSCGTCTACGCEDVSIAGGKRIGSLAGRGGRKGSAGRGGSVPDTTGGAVVVVVEVAELEGSTAVSTGSATAADTEGSIGISIAFGSSGGKFADGSTGISTAFASSGGRLVARAGAGKGVAELDDKATGGGTDAGKGAGEGAIAAVGAAGNSTGGTAAWPVATGAG